MRVSQFFMPVLRETPAEASIVSHQLMLRAGMIRQLASGLYNWLPLGLMVLEKISAIIDDEMQKAGANKMLMPCIQPATLWQESGRYDDYGKEMLRMEDRHENALLFGPTHEEVMTDLARQNFKSYRDLPKNLYQIQWKFRDEIRPRFGVMRGREFLMKDAYSFDLDMEGATKQYYLMMATYMRIFARMGLQAIPIRANTGAIGGDLSHEFHIVAGTGESEIFYDKAFESLEPGDTSNIDTLLGLYSAADERHDPQTCNVPANDLRSSRGIEVGHIFCFGTKYSEAMGATVTAASGQEVTLQMGSYGIGVSRLVGAIIEASHDSRGIIWPLSVAPFAVSLINLRAGHEACTAACETLYQSLKAKGISVLYDDTEESAGSKLATHDLIGMPFQVVIGPRGLEQGAAELKYRKNGQTEMVPIEEIVEKLAALIEG